jgi:hypothetical protein
VPLAALPVYRLRRKMLGLDACARHTHNYTHTHTQREKQKEGECMKSVDTSHDKAAFFFLLVWQRDARVSKQSEKRRGTLVADGNQTWSNRNNIGDTLAPHERSRDWFGPWWRAG